MNTAMLTQTQKTQLDITSVAQVLLGGCLISLFAKAAIYLPFSPVPIILQNSLILLMAAFLGSRKGLLATLFFIFQGSIGLPVFASGSGSILSLIGPTGGYIIGYAFAAYMTGYLFENTRKMTQLKAFAYFTIANFLIVHLLGVFQLSFFIGMNKAILLGCLPFIVGDLLKNMIITKCYFQFRNN